VGGMQLKRTPRGTCNGAGDVNYNSFMQGKPSLVEEKGGDQTAGESSSRQNRGGGEN
jgi:hypothetical protein